MSETRPVRPAPALPWPPREELRWAALFAAAFMACTCLPYLAGLTLRQPGWYYSGLLTNPDEHNVYLSYLRQVQEGRLFLVDAFTSEPQSGRVVNVFFLALGLLARITHLPLPVVYHIGRLASGWLLLMAAYGLAAQALATPPARKVALVLLATASGFGWLYPAAGGQPHPVDYGPGLVMPEAITFLSLLLNPLFCFSMFLMVVAIGLGAHAIHTGSIRHAALAGLAALVLGNTHSYDVIPVAVVLAAYLVVSLATRQAGGRGLAAAVVISVLAVPSLLYQYWLFRIGEPGMVAKTLGQWGYARGPWFLALGLGLPLLISAGGVVRSMRRDAPHQARVLTLWLALGFALVCLPVPFQRKLAEGLHIPACLLAAYALEQLWRAARRRGLVAGAVLVALAVPSNVCYVKRALGDLVTNNTAYLGNLMPPLYLRPDQRAALQALDEMATERDLLLANSFLSSYAPSLAGVRVYVGHWSETLRYVDKLKELSRFLGPGASDAERQAFCRERGITFVLRDRTVYDGVLLPSQARAEPAFDPDRAHWLTRVFQEGEVSLHRIEGR